MSKSEEYGSEYLTDEMINYHKSTITETYSLVKSKSILKQLESDGVFSYTENLHTTNEDSLYVPAEIKNRNEREILLHLLEERPSEAIKVIQEKDFLHPYTYSVLFEFLEELDFNAIKNYLLDNNYVQGSDSFDDLKSNIQEIIPTIKLDEDNKIITLKYAILKHGFLPQPDDNRRDLIYPLFIIIDFKHNIVELRYEHAKGYIHIMENDFYIKRIEEGKQIIENLLHVDLIPINLSAIINHIKKEIYSSENHELAVSAQAFSYRSGSKAILDTGSDDNMVLPLIGNIKGILTEHENLFAANEETAQIKELLNQIISEAEYLSDHPWITLAWTNDLKSKTIMVKFQFNYLGKDYSILNYYGDNADSERMSYVRQIIVDKKQEFEKTLEEETDN